MGACRAPLLSIRRASAALEPGATHAATRRLPLLSFAFAMMSDSALGGLQLLRHALVPSPTCSGGGGRAASHVRRRREYARRRWHPPPKASVGNVRLISCSHHSPPTRRPPQHLERQTPSTSFFVPEWQPTVLFRGAVIFRCTQPHASAAGGPSSAGISFLLPGTPNRRGGRGAGGRSCSSLSHVLYLYLALCCGNWHIRAARSPSRRIISRWARPPI